MPHGKTSSTSHRNKRPYDPTQLSITDFLSPRDFGDSADSDCERGAGPNIRARPSATRQQLHQQLPPESVQADLLSVGMRVRKNVADGYKTHKTHKTMSLPSIQTTLGRSPNGSMTTTQEYSVNKPRDAVPTSVQHQRELLPFCGLAKIGGFAAQPITNVHLYGGSDASGERALNIFPLPAEAFTQPFGSQSSTNLSISNSSVRPPNPGNLHKRSWQDEDETPVRLSSDFLFKIPRNISDDDVPISPLSATPPNSLPQAPLRHIAQPKTKKWALRAADFNGMVIKEIDDDMDIENVEQAPATILAGNSSDFDEAEFLQPYGAGREVHMSGI